MKSCESMSSQQLQEFTNALLSIQKGAAIAPLSPKGEVSGVTLLAEGEAGETPLMLPKFRVGSFTTAGLLASETRLGALAALSNYMNEDEQQAGEWWCSLRGLLKLRTTRTVFSIYLFSYTSTQAGSDQAQRYCQCTNPH